MSSRRTVGGLVPNVGLAFIGDFAAKAGMFAALLLAARLLPSAQFARLSVAMAVILISTSVLDVGFSTVIIRDGAASAAIRRATLEASLTERIPLALTLGFGVTVAGTLMKHGELAAIIALSIAANAAQLTALAVFRSAQSLVPEAATKIVTGVSSPFVVIGGAVLISRSAMTVLAALTIAPLLSLVPLIYGLRRHVVSRHRAVRRPKIFREALPFGAMAVSTLIYYRSGTLTLGWLGTATETANYATASTIAFGLLMLPAAVATALLPRLSSGVTTSERNRITRIALAGSTGSFLVIGALVCSTAWWVVPFAYGERYAGAVRPLLILTAAGVLIGASTVIGTALIAARRTRILMVQVAAALLINLIANFAFIPVFGPTGAALSTLLTEAISLVMLVTAYEREAPGVLRLAPAVRALTPRRVVSS